MPFVGKEGVGLAHHRSSGSRDGGSFGARAGWAAGLVAVFVALGVLAPAAARADGHRSFTLSDEQLLTGELGSISSSGRTDGYDGSGPCTDASHPAGYPHGAVYRIEAPVRSLLDLSISDDADGSHSVCRVALYTDQAGGVSFRDPFDAAQRSALSLTATDSCAASSSCSLRRWLDGGRIYHVVVFAAPEAETGGAEASFRLDGRLRRSSSIALSITGHRIKDRCYGYHEVISGRRVTVRARVSPATAGTIRFQWYGASSSGSSWRLSRTEDHEVNGGVATFSTTVSSGGRRRIRATFMGNETVVPVASTMPRFRLVTPHWYRYAGGGVRLWVPYHRQQHRLSCEAAALRMAHNYFHPGAIDRDMQVYRITGIDPRRPARWGGCDPDRAFCGRVDGLMMRDGYGVHAGPIARAATAYDRCRPGLRLVDYSAATIASHINNGYPVVVWGAHAGPSGIVRYRWRAWTGRYVTAWSIEHTWTVIGFRGPVSNPSRFIVHNPSGSRAFTVSRSQFRSFTKYFETAVVVRG